MEYAQMKGNFLEEIIMGKSKILIENGSLNMENLKIVKLTVYQLEMNLREKNIMNVSDVQWATLEPNGRIGFALKLEVQPVTKKEFQQLLHKVDQALSQIPTSSS